MGKPVEGATESIIYLSNTVHIYNKAILSSSVHRVSHAEKGVGVISIYVYYIMYLYCRQFR